MAKKDGVNTPGQESEKKLWPPYDDYLKTLLSEYLAAYEPGKQKSVSAVLIPLFIAEGGDVVFAMGRKPEEGNYPERWVFPGGKVDGKPEPWPREAKNGIALPAEDVQVGVRREALEEAGLHPDKVVLVQRRGLMVKNNHLVVPYLGWVKDRTTMMGLKPVDREFDKIEFFSMRDVFAAMEELNRTGKSERVAIKNRLIDGLEQKVSQPVFEIPRVDLAGKGKKDKVREISFLPAIMLAQLAKEFGTVEELKHTMIVGNVKPSPQAELWLARVTGKGQKPDGRN